MFQLDANKTMIDHEAITKIITAQGKYGTGITPNPFASRNAEWQRRHVQAVTRKMITDKIVSLFEPRFITPPETSEAIEAIVTLTDSRQILELGTCTGFSALHILRAIVGKEGAKLTCVEHRPEHDRKFFAQPDIARHFEFLEEPTPDSLRKLSGNIYDLVFVDSDHSVEHCEKELAALWPITRPGTVILFHDCPQQQNPQSAPPAVIWSWLHNKVAEGKLRGTCFPSCEQLDCLATWGPGYPKECNPGLGMFIRT